MKKILLLAAAVIAIMTTNCGNKTDANATNDSLSDAALLSPEAQQFTDSLTALLSKQLGEKNTEAVKTTLTTLQAKYAELVKEGKSEEAKTYASKIQEFINTHTEEINNVATGNTTVSSLVNGIANLPSSASTTAQDAVDAVKSDASTIATNAKDSVKSAVTSTVNQTTTNVQNKVNEKVAEGQQKVSDKVNEATSNALKGIGLK